MCMLCTSVGMSCVFSAALGIFISILRLMSMILMEVVWLGGGQEMMRIMLMELSLLLGVAVRPYSSSTLSLSDQ